VLNNNLIWQTSVFSPPKDEKIRQTLPLALMEIAQQSPNSVAVITPEKSYSFGDLMSRVAGLSEEINAFSYNNGPIALVQKNGLDAIAAWFACSLSGKTFVLLEPDHPPLRLIELMKASGCSLVLVDQFTSSIFKDFPEINQLVSDGRLGTIQQNKGLNVEDPAMLFPTSGSTGKPKLITYASTTIQVKVQSSMEQMRVPKGARVLIAGSHSNYGFLHHALVFLLSGGAVCLADVKTFGFDAILNSINNQGVRHVRFTPSLFRKLAVLPQVKNTLMLLDGVRFSGEPLLQSDLQLAQSVLKSDCLIQNVYGSTESALFIWSNLDAAEIGELGIVPIGKIYPLSSFAIQPLNDGDITKGELLIKSKFHALGDLKNGVVDTERFPLIQNSTNERMYATGDIVQQLPNGNLIVLGRLGRMVKIRGNRVFLNEVENHFRMLTKVTGAAVVEYDYKGDKALFGFVTIEENTAINKEQLRAELIKSLPEFMIPKQIKIVSTIPLLEGGKVDYNFLVSQIETTEFVDDTAIVNDDFARLIQLWDAVLWKGAHQFYSDFISLGGDSLNAMILIAKIEEEFEKKVSIADFKANSTLPAMAMMLEIKIPHNYTVKVKDKLQIKSFAPCEHHSSKGIALAIPGYRGWTQAYPFHKSGILQDYDIWVAEYPIQKGFIIHYNQWWDAALEIVENIREGKIPVPKVIVGFSFSGGLAWIISRLLSGTPYSPEFVVMVDSPPIHRLKKYKNKALKKALESVAHIQPVPSVHIIRNSLFANNNSARGMYRWNTLDHIKLVLKLPTVEHLEMVNWKLLSLVKHNFNAFLNYQSANHMVDYPEELPDLLGVHIYNAFKGSEPALNKIMDELTKGLEKLSTEHLMNITILFHQKNYIQKAKDIMQFMVCNQPNSGSIQFLNRRLKRNSNLLLNKNIPSFIPHNLVDIELLLASNQFENINSKPLIIKYFVFILDFVLAMINKKLWLKIQQKYNSVIKITVRKHTYNTK